jgi:hypothetical protein
MDRLTPILLEQDGVVSRRQALPLGLSDHALARLVRRRELSRVHPGVYVDHTGPLQWGQRAWAAVLFYWPAALWRESSLHAFGLRGMDESNIYVAIDASRTGVRIGAACVSTAALISKNACSGTFGRQGSTWTTQCLTRVRPRGRHRPRWHWLPTSVNSVARPHNACLRRGCLVRGCAMGDSCATGWSTS